MIVFLYPAESVCAYGVSEWNCALFTGGSTNGHCKWQVPVSTWVNPNMTEDWDKGSINNHNFDIDFCVD